MNKPDIIIPIYNLKLFIWIKSCFENFLNYLTYFVIIFPNEKAFKFEKENLVKLNFTYFKPAISCVFYCSGHYFFLLQQNFKYV